MLIVRTLSEMRDLHINLKKKAELGVRETIV